MVDRLLAEQGNIRENYLRCLTVRKGKTITIIDPAGLETVL